MKAAFTFVLFPIITACANEAPVKDDATPDWSGPPLAVTSRADRGLELEMTAPTAGHAFELRSVDDRGAIAEVRLLHRTPGDAFVAQVLTTLRVSVDRERLGEARRVRVWIATQHGVDGSPAGERLAFVIARP